MPMENREVKEAIQKELPAIFAVFATKLNNDVKANSMDDLYVELIRAHHNVVTNGRYNQEYIAEHRQETKKAIKDMKRLYLDKAKAVIQQIREKYTEQPKRPDRPTDETAYQLQRSNNLTLWTAQLPVATVDELRELYYKHRFDEDFMTLLDVELRKRDEPAALQLKYEIEHPEGDTFVELDKLEKSLEFVLNGHYYPHGLTQGVTNIRYRDVDKDLDAYPIENGPTFRPVFKLPA